VIPNDCEHGFALVEACAALGVMAVVAAMFVGTMQSSAMTSRHLAQKREATMIARSQMAFAVEVARGGETGRAGPYAWQIAVSGYPSAGSAPGLEQVTVRVLAEHNRAGSVELRMLRLAR